jgi:hypothetical protein
VLHAAVTLDSSMQETSEGGNNTMATNADHLTMHAFDRGKVERFATLPPGEAYPEGIDADADGNVYVVTVGANKPDTSMAMPRGDEDWRGHQCGGWVTGPLPMLGGVPLLTGHHESRIA